MSEKKKFLLRIDDKVFQAFEKWAADNLRSVNAQIEYVLKEALQKNGRVSVEQSIPAEPEHEKND